MKMTVGLQAITAYFNDKQKASGVKLLWGYRQTCSPIVVI
jgi:xylose isomerase